ncbi:hypothetical protein K8B33_11775 [Alcanivorax sp. JB21]|uniref:hypothetical protein n=1 Tax=Alcanivorax limicola TaxID=2874102 RepID=UPI001CBBD5C9|nr:hypothetical protein [Alcanivorax limicola]MBZ2189780.1 hypothetical protein [Alcanivorax limicola]
MRTVTGNFYDELSRELFDRDTRLARPASHIPVVSELARLSAPLGMASAGAGLLMLAGLLGAALGLVPAYAGSLFLVVMAWVMVALALDGDRPVFMLAAVANLLVTLLALYQGAAMLPIYGAHGLLVGIALLDRVALNRGAVQIWFGAELAALGVLVVTHL